MITTQRCPRIDVRRIFPRLTPVLRGCVLRLIPGLLLLGSQVFADNPAFDLPGPRIEVRVTRGGKTLPIFEVPELQAGDRLWLCPEIPANQSVHYLLIAAFLRGSTDPPPEQWFVKAETWNRQVRQEGIVVTVPQGGAAGFAVPGSGNPRRLQHLYVGLSVADPEHLCGPLRI